MTDLRAHRATVRTSLGVLLYQQFAQDGLGTIRPLEAIWVVTAQLATLRHCVRPLQISDLDVFPRVFEPVAVASTLFACIACIRRRALFW